MTTSNSDEQRFSPELLLKPKEEWENYFVEYAARHPVLDNAFTKLVSIINDPGGKKLVFVIGPPGVGKTFLMKAVKAEIQAQWSQQQLSDRGRIPIVGIEVPSKDTVNPSYSIIYERLLIDMEEPLVEKKTVYADVAIQRGIDGRLSINQRIKNSKLRYAFEQAMKHRRPYAVFLDETQHLLDIGGLSIHNHMDNLKSIANLTNTLFVLFGTYEMSEFLDLSDHLIRRSAIIHFRRYRKTVADRKVFLRALKSFQINMPFEKEPDLMRHWEFFYDRTAGCIGNLYDWLAAAYKKALKDSNALTLTDDHLEETVFLSDTRAQAMDRSISQGESALKTVIGTGETYFKSRKKAAASRNGNNESKAQEKPKKPRKRRRRVGDPKPKRYGTGGGNKK